MRSRRSQKELRLRFQIYIFLVLRNLCKCLHLAQKNRHGCRERLYHKFRPWLPTAATVISPFSDAASSAVSSTLLGGPDRLILTTFTSMQVVMAASDLSVPALLQVSQLVQLHLIIRMVMALSITMAYLIRLFSQALLLIVRQPSHRTGISIILVAVQMDY